jgi:hypothetical protein
VNGARLRLGDLVVGEAHGAHHLVHAGLGHCASCSARSAGAPTRVVGSRVTAATTACHAAARAGRVEARRQVDDDGGRRRATPRASGPRGRRAAGWTGRTHGVRLSHRRIGRWTKELRGRHDGAGRVSTPPGGVADRRGQDGVVGPHDHNGPAAGPGRGADGELRPSPPGSPVLEKPSGRHARRGGTARRRPGRSRSARSPGAGPPAPPRSCSRR